MSSTSSPADAAVRHFNTRFRLLDTDRNIRLLYTLFILTIFAGFLFTIYWAHSMTGLSYSGIAQHYLGSDQTFGQPKSFQELAETTHFHFFTMPVVFLILCHVFYLTLASQELKVIMTVLAFAGVALDLASPWLILYVSPHFALSMLLGDVLMVGAFLVMAGVPLYRSEEHTSELQTLTKIVCRLLLEKKKLRTEHFRGHNRVPCPCGS